MDTSSVLWRSRKTGHGAHTRNLRATGLVALIVSLLVGLAPDAAHAHDYGPAGLNGAQVKVDPDGYNSWGVIWYLQSTVTGKGFKPLDVAQIFLCQVGAVDLHHECQPLGAAPTDLQGNFRPTDVVWTGTIRSIEHPDAVGCRGFFMTQPMCAMVAATFGPDLQPTSKAEHWVCWNGAEYGKCDPQPTS